MATLVPVTSDDRVSPHPHDEDGDPRSSSFSGAEPGDPEAPNATTATASEAAPDGRSKRSRRKRKQLPLWQETILLLAVALVLAFVIKAFFLQAFYIPSESMVPGLQVNDRILVEKPSYWGDNGPQRGDVVVFEDPGGWLGSAAAEGPSNPIAQVMSKIGLYPTGGHLVKRVIGLEGDVISCCDDQGRILVNGQPLDEPYLADGLQCNGPEVNGCTADWETVEVPEGQMFVMGDNRSQSEDSAARICDPALDTACTTGREFVDTDLVVGKVFAVVWPRSSWDWLERPETFADVPDPR